MASIRFEIDLSSGYKEFSYLELLQKHQGQDLPDRFEENLVDKGYGYDRKDPFIDDGEAYDEHLPSEITTKYGGFYINSGRLEFKKKEPPLKKKKLSQPVKTPPTANPKPTTTLNPKPTQTLNPKPTQTLNPKPTQTLHPKSAPTLNSKPAPTLNSKPVPTLNPKSTPTPIPKATSTPNPKAVSTPNPKAISSANLKATSTVTPTSKPAATLNAKPPASLNAKPSSTLSAKPNATSTPKPNATPSATLTVKPMNPPPAHTTKQSAPQVPKQAPLDLTSIPWQNMPSTSNAVLNYNLLAQMFTQQIYKRPPK